jgi:polysaccharide biosynthesis transport protein
MEDTHVHALDYVSVLRRRKWWLVTPVVASVFVGAALVRWLPKEFRSTTTLGVSAPVVSPSFVSQSTPFDNQERLRAISQQLLSLPVLTRVVREEGAASGTPVDSQIVHLRNAIQISVPDPVATTNEPRRLDTFVVSYGDADPARAQRIANRLATVFVDENSNIRAERAGDTSAFISTQLRASQVRLGDLEARLREAKEAHMGQLPEQMAANLQTLAGLRQQFEANATALRSEQDRLSMIQRQIDDLKQGRGGVAVARTGAQPAESRVTVLERDLAAARATYTERHPEVQRLEEELAKAKNDAAARQALPEADRMVELQTDPAFRQLSADREASNLRIRELQRGSADLQRQISQYQGRIEATPMVEQQMATVQRDFDLEKQQYSDLSAKLHAATIAENVERNRDGEQLTVLYPASFPSQPTKPIPMRVMLVSILGGLCLGAALMLGREYLDRSVHTAREIKDDLDVPVLGEVAHIVA